MGARGLIVGARGLIKEHGWVPEPRLGPATPGHRASAKNKGEATGNRMVEGKRVIYQALPDGSRDRSGGSLPEPGGSSLAGPGALSPDISPSPPPPAPATQHIPPACQGSFRRPGGEGGRMPMWVSAGPLLARAARGERGILQIRKLLFGSLRM